MLIYDRINEKPLLLSGNYAIIEEIIPEVQHVKHRILPLMLSGVIAAACAAILPANAETETKQIALSFDDGPNTYTTPQVLDVLEEYDARASFFLIGKNINEESAEVVKRAYAMGCEIDSHSRNHYDMTELSVEEIAAEIQYVDDAVYEIIGEYPKFFRPPYLNVNDTMYETIDIPFITGYSSGDSSSEVTAEDVAEKVLSQAKDGAIILMHDFYGNDKTVEALHTILPELESQGYEFVTIGELFESREETPLDYTCYMEVMRHPCKGYALEETLFAGEVSGEKDWEGWNTTILLDAEKLQAFEDFTIEVAYESERPPMIILHRWASSEDNFWVNVQPVYYNGRKACFRSSDLQAVLDTYNTDYLGLQKIIVRTNWTTMTITQVDLLTKSDSLAGDVDLNGKFDLTDLIAVQKYLLAIPDQKLAAWEHADFCADGVLDGFDLAAMKRALLKGGTA